MQVAKGIGADGIQRPNNNWRTIDKLPDLIESHWQGYSGSVWYKIDWNYQCAEPNLAPMTFVISYINMAGQIYSNDDLLWQDQSLIEPLSRSWNMPRYWNLPASSLKQGENTLWIRVVGVTSQSSGLGEFSLGTSEQVMPKYQTYWTQQRVLMFFNLIFSLTLGIIAFLVWIFYRKDSTFGWFSLASLAWAMVMTNVIMLNAPFDLTTLQIARISIICFFVYSLFSCFYAWRLARRSFPRLEKLLFLFLFIASSFAILLPNSALYSFISILFYISILILLINFSTYPFIAYQSKLQEAYLLAAIFILFMIVSIHDTLSLIRFNNRFSWMPYTAPLSTLFIAIILAMRLANNIRRIEYFNKTLAESVTHAKNELTILLKTQHQLELENTKLQERIHLAHDLHDSLGSSLVRSMVIVDQSTNNLTNLQFLSILKLLRNDLRQIIDNGSSSSIEAPATPKIWSAATRYRFVQIFDELEIESTWNLPEKWQIQPTTFECLTLLRVIEETLTNIIKHSQAKRVRVSLYYSDMQSLVMEIEDDGIGFDVAAVTQSGMSVGLRSIKIRLEKIQASFDIQSQQGKTLIQVIKVF